MRLKLQCNRLKIVILGISQLFLLVSAHCQLVPFSRGINLAYWFEAENIRQVKFTQYTRHDFEDIKSLGCDVIRVPVHFPNMTDGDPDYTVDPLFYSLFDQVVQWCDELDIYLIIDNHSSGNAGSITDPEIGNILQKIWSQLALHYKDASSYILYEILNEPHDIDNDVWNTAQQEVLSLIREIDDAHTVILSPSNWDDFRSLDSMYVYDDDNVLYTFHFYEPHLFTAQGGANGNFISVSGVPFPYSAETMPPCPAEYIGTWKEQYWLTYQDLGTVDSVRRLMDVASDFASERNVKIFCGEYGSFMSKCPPADRIFWYQTLRSSFEEKEIPWLIWDYHSDMGIFTRGDYYGLFDHDLNIPIIEALGFNVPAQSPLNIQPETEGFPVFLDYVNPVIRERSYTTGDLNFYSTDATFEGTYCIQWTGAAAYNSIVFGFNPFMDLSWLAENGFVLSMQVKGNQNSGSFQLRFLDTKTEEPGDHPWRKSMNISVPGDNTWHLLTIPLSDFYETGAWDTDTWYDPEGQFYWGAIDQLEIATEQMDMGENTFSFDNIVIAPITVTAIKDQSDRMFPDILVNYSTTQQTINISNTGFQDVEFTLFDSSGRIRMTNKCGHFCAISTVGLPSGLYLLQLKEGNEYQIRKTMIY
jgi:endoglucanase